MAVGKYITWKKGKEGIKRPRGGAGIKRISDDGWKSDPSRLQTRFKTKYVTRRRKKDDPRNKNRKRPREGCARKSTESPEY